MCIILVVHNFDSIPRRIRREPKYLCHVTFPTVFSGNIAEFDTPSPPYILLVQCIARCQLKLCIPYGGLFLRGVYFANFEIDAICGINFREVNRKPHPRT